MEKSIFVWNFGKLHEFSERILGKREKSPALIRELFSFLFYEAGNEKIKSSGHIDSVYVLLHLGLAICFTI